MFWQLQTFVVGVVFQTTTWPTKASRATIPPTTADTAARRANTAAAACAEEVPPVAKSVDGEEEDELAAADEDDTAIRPRGEVVERSKWGDDDDEMPP